jgi:predicted RNA-binding protein with PUA-like domain
MVSSCPRNKAAHIYSLDSLAESAFDPEHPYYDAKSDREKPKWCVVHVEFRQKFPEMVKLKELQKYAKPGGLLENLQTLKMSRLSVSKVSKKEWDFIMGLVDIDDVAAASAQHTPQMVT